MTDESFDLVAVGDIVTDAFIRLKDAELHCDVNHEHCKICMAFGAKIPYESVTVVPAVGNSPNAAVAAARLGLKTALVTDLGDDQHGREALATLKKEQVDTGFVRAHEGRLTNYHYVLWFADDRTILIKHEDYSYVLPAIGKPKWLYLSSLGEHSLPYHKALLGYLNANSEIKLAFQPGTFQIKFGHEALTGLYRRSDVFLCNLNEAQKILSLKQTEPKILLEKMRELGPKIIVITDGPRGAYVSDGRTAWFMPPYPDPKAPFERTGAGDAFSATFVAALAIGKTVPEALAWAPINSMSVVQQIGAQAGLLDRPTLENYLAKAPPDYQPRPL
ncbi:MAG: carbohydrate kinase family protein [Candidatus Vogelbacteria bacterium]|nr:carbohydrate kinase family protein [Candidatus Vogelbacteria bacterium]